MKLTKTIELYFQPVLFKTISFHHQSNYSLKFELKYQPKISDRSISAYPSLISQGECGQDLNRTRLVKKQRQNCTQTQKFSILFNDQSIAIGGACKFIIQIDYNTENSLQAQLFIQLFKHQQIKSNNQLNAIQQITKTNTQQISKNNTQQISKTNVQQTSKTKATNVGQSIICVNFNVQKDCFQYSNYRHILFTKDQYFCSFIFYMEFENLDINIRTIQFPKIEQMNLFSQNKKYQILKKQKQKLKKIFKSNTIKNLFPNYNIIKLYKQLIQKRIIKYTQLIQKFNNCQCLKNEQIDQYYKKNEQKKVQIRKVNQTTKDSLLIYNFSLLNFKQTYDIQDYYQTSEQNFIYNNIFYESKAINHNIRNIWAYIIYTKLTSSCVLFQNQAIKFKIDRMMKISKCYSCVQDNINVKINYAQKIAKHQQQKKKITGNSKFYTKNQINHPMFTLNSLNNQNIVSNTIQKSQTQILVILVHGFQGSQRDMSKIKSFINSFSAINFLSLETLKNHSNSDIRTLGVKGAQQINNYLQEKEQISSISFIGFSLGSILIKSMLPYLSNHWRKFNLFLSLSSPHLGLCQLQNCLINTYLYFMKKLSKAKNIKELCCEEIEGKIFLVDSAKNEGLGWFRKVVLVGSQQDGIVPSYSALVKYDGQNQIINQIQRNTLSSIKSLDRITVWFEYEQDFIDKMTGRKSHTFFIEDDNFIQFIIIKYLEYF